MKYVGPYFSYRMKIFQCRLDSFIVRLVIRCCSIQVDVYHVRTQPKLPDMINIIKGPLEHHMNRHTIEELQKLFALPRHNGFLLIGLTVRFHKLL